MKKPFPLDKSNGYEQAAEAFMSARNPRIGPATVREWSRSLPPGSAVLDLGCGHGVPISQSLMDEGFAVYGIDASSKLISAFRKRFPLAHAECSAVEDSQFFQRKFDSVIACGLIFLLPVQAQILVLRKVCRTLIPGGRFLFTAPKEAATWQDSLTGLNSISLGAERYTQILRTEGLEILGQYSDEGDNHYYSAQSSSNNSAI